jgi:hypothetical protein
MRLGRTTKHENLEQRVSLVLQAFRGKRLLGGCDPL